MAKIIVGVMGPGSASEETLATAEKLGQLIAEQGWILLTGGRNAGVMDATSRGAKESGGLTVGILPTGDRSGMSPNVDIPIVTDVGSARNNINVLSSEIVIACGVGMGTISEVLLAAKAGKYVILLHQTSSSKAFLEEFSSPRIHFVFTAEEAITLAKELLQRQSNN
ncbi:TIGR00725 family protein [Aliifodinibius sp. S!AR15-10]|uniref:TIGR00725 family protein n=1 Tax=Aliifodinibius sp. S!AR15-10 TaxID=2950437 RepID=UPI00285657F2|nr:TIGR00725 family protein [Aliifodinibius sp. S!AR15-10]MDR8393133.1 TIGR00725 family protein [Aliifodinibius sp. S!AR15-10]